MWVLKRSGASFSEEYIIPKDKQLFIGRQGCDINMDDKSVSRKHASIFIDGESLIIEDLKSRFGTQLNGKSLPSSSQKLYDGDVLLFGAAESEPLLVQKISYTFYFLSDFDADLKSRLLNFGINVSSSITRETTHIVLKSSSVEPSKELLNVLKFDCRILQEECVVRILDEMKLDNLRENQTFLRIVSPTSRDLVEFSLKTERMYLLRDVNFIIADPSLKSCIESFGASVSTSMIKNIRNFNLGHFNESCPTISLSELVSVIALCDLDFLDRLESEYERQQEDLIQKPAESKQPETKPTIQASTALAGDAQVVVEFTDLMRPAKVSPSMASTSASVNFKRFRKTPGIKRNLSCIGISDMVAYKSIMETGVNNEKQEQWLQESTPEPKNRRISDGFGEVQKKQSKKEAVKYQPIVAIDLTDENSHVNAKKESSKNEAGFRSSFFSSIV